MDTELRKLYNTLMLIETKGEGTKLMVECLNFIEQLIARVSLPETPAEQKPTTKDM